MAAKKPRIMFTPSDRALTALRRVATVTGKPVSTIAAQQVDVMVDHLENLASVLEAAERLQREDPEAVLAAARAAFEQMMPILDRAGEQVDDLWDELHARFDFGPGSMEPKPPSSNTGATTGSGTPPGSPLKAVSNG